MLTDRQIKAAKAADKPYKIFDAHGLHLLVSPTGAKSWRLKYRIGGKEKQVGFGTYPEVRLAQAREMLDKARKTLRDGGDPATEFGRRSRKSVPVMLSETTFEYVARRWWDLHRPMWKDRHSSDVITSLERDIFPTIGATQIAQLKPADLRPLLIAVQDRGAVETAHRLLQRLAAIFGMALAEELVDMDPTSQLSLSLRKIIKGRQPAILSIEQARSFLRVYEAVPGYPMTKLASRLLALTAARPGMVQMAEPREFEQLGGPDPIWRVPPHKMKLSKTRSESSEFEFVLPLSRQSVEVVLQAMELSRGRKYLFASARHSHRPITDNALNAAYRKVRGWEGKHVPHGWRSTFSTIMNERAIMLERPGDRAIIDLMLAHIPEGVEARYNRAAYMPRRRELAQEWADLLCVDLMPVDSFEALPRH